MGKQIKIRRYKLTQDGRWVCCCCTIIIAVLVTSIIMFAKSVEQIDWVYGRVLDTPQLYSKDCDECGGGVLTTKSFVNLDAASVSSTGGKNDHDPCGTGECFTVQIGYIYRVDDNSFLGQDFVDFRRNRAAAHLYIESHPTNSTVIVYFNTLRWDESSLSHMAANSGWLDILIVSACCLFCCFLFYLFMCWKGLLGFIFEPVSLRCQRNDDRNNGDSSHNQARNYRTIYNGTVGTDVKSKTKTKTKTKSKKVDAKKVDAKKVDAKKQPDARTRLVHSV